MNRQSLTTFNINLRLIFPAETFATRPSARAIFLFLFLSFFSVVCTAGTVTQCGARRENGDGIVTILIRLTMRSIIRGLREIELSTRAGEHRRWEKGR